MLARCSRNGDGHAHSTECSSDKTNLRSFKSSEHINENTDGSYRGFGYLRLFSDPLDLAKWNQREVL